VEFYAVAHEDIASRRSSIEIPATRLNLKMGGRFAGRVVVFLLLGCDW